MIPSATSTARTHFLARWPWVAAPLFLLSSAVLLSMAGPGCGQVSSSGEVVRSQSAALTRPSDAHRADWDGDGITDVVIFRPGNVNGNPNQAPANPTSGQWWYMQSSNSQSFGWNWGRATDVPLLGDYDGDGKEDLTVWQQATGSWFTALSKYGFAGQNVQWGVRGDVPVPGDYDGDGKTDQAIWRPYDTSSPGCSPSAPCIGYWWRRSSATGGSLPVFQYGEAGDVPVPADYDGDGKTDMAVWRPSTGQWCIVWSSGTGPGNNGHGADAFQWGAPTDIPLAGLDYDQDGKSDLVVYRPQTNQWYFLLSSNLFQFNSSEFVHTFSPALQPPDVPVVGDYRGSYFASRYGYDSNFAAWRPSTGVWTAVDYYTNQNTMTAPVGGQWGGASTLDVPVNGVNRFPIVNATAPTPGPFGAVANTLGARMTSIDSSQGAAASSDGSGGWQTTAPFTPAAAFPGTGGGKFGGHDGDGGWETTVLTIPPNVSCDPSNGKTSGPYGVALANDGQSGVTQPGGGIYRDTLSCWQNGTNCEPSWINLTTRLSHALPSTMGGDQVSYFWPGDDHNFVRLKTGHIIAARSGGQETNANPGNPVGSASCPALLPNSTCGPKQADGTYYGGDFCCTCPNQPNKWGAVEAFLDSADCGATWTMLSTISGKDLSADHNPANYWQYAEIDRGYVYSNPYSNNLYFTLQNDLNNCIAPPAANSKRYSLLFRSKDNAHTWQPMSASGATQPGDVGLLQSPTYVMTAAPSGRVYIFGCPNNQPTLYTASDSTGQLMGIPWTESQNTSSPPNQLCGNLTLPAANNKLTPSNPQISLVSSEEDGDVVRIAYPQITSAPREYVHLVNVSIATATSSACPNLNSLTAGCYKELSQNSIFASNPLGSVMEATMISPELIELPPSRQTNATLLYWLETNGDPKNPATGVTVNGTLLRDMNLWGPVFAIAGNDPGGIPWTGWSKRGDYVFGGFAYDSTSDMLNFFPVWAGSSESTWWVNTVTAHP
jgi:hypothetical protein